MSKVSSNVPAEFAKLSDEGKFKFTAATLESLIKIASNQKSKEKFFKKFLLHKGKKQLTQDEVDTIYQLITVFLYSLKEEFRYHWAKLMCLLLPPQMVPAGLMETADKRIQEVSSRRFVHLSFEPKPYKELQKIVDKLGGWDEFFSHALDALKGAGK